MGLPILQMINSNLSCTVSAIRRLNGRKLRTFHTALLFGAPAPYLLFGISRWS